MYKRIFLILIIFNFINNCGFTPLHSINQTANFSLEIVSFEGDRKINNYLKANLSRFENDKFDRKFTIKVNTNYNKKIISKDKTGKVSNYELSVISVFQTTYQGKLIKKFELSERKTIDNIEDKFEEQKYEKSVKQNFANAISNKLITELSLLNDL